MLLKLLKYDFRAMWKQFSLIWGAALALSLVNRFTLDGQNSTSLVGEHTAGLLMFAFAGVMTAMFVLAIIFVIQRFSKGLLGSEGYLMHTLPVRSWQLVASKLICGAVTWMASGMVALLCPFIMAPVDWSDLLQFPWWKAFWSLLKHPDTILLLLEFCLMVFSAIVLSIAVMYLAMSIGHLAPRHRKLASVAVFIGLYIILLNFYTRAFSIKLIQHLLNLTTINVHGSMLTSSATMLLPALAFLAAVSWILENKLNLE